MDNIEKAIIGTIILGLVSTGGVFVYLESNSFLGTEEGHNCKTTQVNQTLYKRCRHIEYINYTYYDNSTNVTKTNTPIKRTDVELIDIPCVDRISIINDTVCITNSTIEGIKVE